MTIFINSLIFPFNGRQKAHVAKWCDENNLIDKDDKRAVCFALNGWKCQTPTNDKARPCVQHQQSLLGIQDANTKVTTEWLRNHPEQVLWYYWHMLGDMEQLDDVKKFTLAPVAQIKNNFLTIDTRALYAIMKTATYFLGI